MIKSNEKEMGRDLGRTLAVAIPTLVTVFPNSMVGNVKLAINQADPRVGAYDELVEEHSECDFITRGGCRVDPRGPNEQGLLASIEEPCDEAIPTLRKRP